MFQVDVRLVAATTKSLEEEITKGTFREDLYHRINVIPLNVPPMRERREDIPLLATHFLKELAKENETPPKTISAEALEALNNLPWPGNVRELKNFIWRLAILSPGHHIEVQDFGIASPTAAEAAPGGLEALLGLCDFREARAEFEREFPRRKLAQHQGSVSRTAEAIGLERLHLYRKLRSYGLEAVKDAG